MKYYLIYTDVEGLHCEEYEDVAILEDALTDTYRKYALKESGTQAPMIVYGNMIMYDPVLNVDCKILI